MVIIRRYTANIYYQSTLKLLWKKSVLVWNTVNDSTLAMTADTTMHYRYLLSTYYQKTVGWFEFVNDSKFYYFFIVMATANSKYSKICLFTKYLNQNKLGEKV